MEDSPVTYCIGKSTGEFFPWLNVEPAWEKVCQGKFSLTSRTLIQPNGGTCDVPRMGESMWAEISADIKNIRNTKGSSETRPP